MHNIISSNSKLIFSSLRLSHSANMTISDTHFLLSFMQIFILYLSCFTAKADKASNKKISGFYVFGDSTVDSGNNNYIKTLFRSNFPPYGSDFINHVPTGRFSNGKLATDYIGN